MNLQIRNRAIDELVPYARNARTHSAEQVAQIAASIREFGFIVPVLLDGENGIVAGHGRVLAARKLGLAEVPCIEAKHLTEAQKRAFVIADNKLAMNAGWDDDLLRVELTDLKLADFDVSLTGFSTDEIAELMAAVDGPLQGDPDDTPEPPNDADVYVQRGDLYVLGAHRILCGDSTVIADVDRVIAGALADAAWTDPPYGVAYESEKHDAIANDALEGAEFATFLRKAFTGINRALKPGAAIYVAHADTLGHVFRNEFLAQPWKLASCLIWKKDSLVLGRGDFHWIHEPMLYGWKDGAAHHKVADRTQTTVWEIARPKRSDEHPTMKPVELVARALRNSTSHGDVVFESFSGSGSTLIACEQTGRACRAIELEPKYVHVAIERWQTLTGKAATLDGDGRTFDEVKAAREVTHEAEDAK